MNVFVAVKENVSARDAAELYGLRVGRRGMTVCPFHNDRNPSLKVDRRFHCFGCQADGDVIDFVARLFDLPCKAAAIKIAEDFHIPYDARERPPNRPVVRELSEEQKLRQAERRYCKVLEDYRQLLRVWEETYAPTQADADWDPRFVEAVQRKDYVDYLLDEFLDATPEERKMIVTDMESEGSIFEQRIQEAAVQEYGRGDGTAGSDREGRTAQHDQELSDGAAARSGFA